MKVGELVLVEIIDDCALSGSRGDKGDQGVEEVDDCRDQDKSKPEPDKQVNLFVEHVNHQNTLDGIIMEIGQSSDLEVAESHSGEHMGVHPVLAIDKLEHCIQAPETVCRSQEAVQNNELSEDVKDIEEFDDDVQS